MSIESELPLIIYEQFRSSLLPSFLPFLLSFYSGHVQCLSLTGLTGRFFWKPEEFSSLLLHSATQTEKCELRALQFFTHSYVAEAIRIQAHNFALVHTLHSMWS